MHRHFDLATSAYGSRWRKINPAEPALFCVGLLVLTLMLPPRPWSVVSISISATAALLWARVGAGAWFRWMISPTLFAAVASLALAWSDTGAATDLFLRASAASSCAALLSLTVPFPSLLRLGRLARIPEPVLELAWMMHGSARLMVDHILLARATLTRRAPAKGWRAELQGFAMAALSGWRRGVTVIAARDRCAERRTGGGLVLLEPEHPVRLPVCGAALSLHIAIALAAWKLAR
jgi:cobalt/nickel transport system permease protein